MCLNRITKRTTLKADKKVWGKVCIDIDGDECAIYAETKIKHGLNKAKVIKNNGVVEIPKDKYKPGFHRFLKKRDAVNYWGYSDTNVNIILPYIIPKGTKVVYGKIAGLGSEPLVIVSPVIINPRIEGKSKE